MILAAKWAREKKVPFLGICLGFQMAVVEVARHVVGVAGELGSLHYLSFFSLPSSSSIVAAITGSSEFVYSEKLLMSCEINMHYFSYRKLDGPSRNHAIAEL